MSAPGTSSGNASSGPSTSGPSSSGVSSGQSASASSQTSGGGGSRPYRPRPPPVKKGVYLDLSQLPANIEYKYPDFFVPGMYVQHNEIHFPFDPQTQRKDTTRPYFKVTKHRKYRTPEQLKIWDARDLMKKLVKRLPLYKICMSQIAQYYGEPDRLCDTGLGAVPLSGRTYARLLPEMKLIKSMSRMDAQFSELMTNLTRMIVLDVERWHANHQKNEQLHQKVIVALQNDQRQEQATKIICSSRVRFGCIALNLDNLETFISGPAQL